MKLNGCIFLISARKNLLKICLTLLERNYNHRFNYPIHIFYHGNKYDDINFRKSIQQKLKSNKTIVLETGAEYSSFGKSLGWYLKAGWQL